MSTTDNIISFLRLIKSEIYGKKSNAFMQGLGGGKGGNFLVPSGKKARESSTGLDWGKMVSQGKGRTESRKLGYPCKKSIHTMTNPVKLRNIFYGKLGTRVARVVRKKRNKSTFLLSHQPMSHPIIILMPGSCSCKIYFLISGKGERKYWY